MTPNYEIIEQAGTLLIEWPTATLPLEIKILASIVLFATPFLYFFRNGISRFAIKHLHFPFGPKVYGLAAPILSLACGVILFFNRDPKPAATWTLTPEGAAVVTVEKRVKMDWKDVETATQPPPKPGDSSAPIVLKSKDGKELWLPMAWLELEHQQKVIEFINRATASKYKLALPSESDETIPAPPPLQRNK